MPREQALNAICPYYTMFPLEYPLAQLENLPKGSIVYDPFCGRGTTTFAARLLGHSSIGTDINPVAIAVAKAKMAHVTPKQIVDLASKILNSETLDPVPSGRFWELAYAPGTLEHILKLRAGLRLRHGSVADALRGIVLGCLHGPQPKTKDSNLSNQMQRTFAPKPDYAVRYWETRGMLPHEVDVIRIISERADRYYTENIPKVFSRVIHGDARNPPITGVSFDATVTSPPYFGMDTYVPDQWLRNWFLGGAEKPTYEKRDQLSRGTKDDFILELGKVWYAIAVRSNPGAKLSIRFGAIASRDSDPETLIRRSLQVSKAPWVIRSIKHAGGAKEGRRQAEQMGAVARKSRAIEELDFVCRLQ